MVMANAKPPLNNSSKIRVTNTPRTSIAQGQTVTDVELFTVASAFQHFAVGERIVLLKTAGATTYLSPEHAEELANALLTTASAINKPAASY